MLLFPLLIIVVVFLYGCESKEESLAKQAESLRIQNEEQLKNEIENLKTQSVQYYTEGDIKNTIALYEKILTLKESIDDRKYLDELIIEKESIETAKSFIEAMKQFESSLDSINNLTELSKYLIEIKSNFDELEKIDTSKNTDITSFVREMLSNKFYLILKDYYNQDFIKNAENNAEINSILDKAIGDFSLTVIDASLFKVAKFNISFALDNIPTDLPIKYRNNF